jgi:hypothetical protein
VTGHPLQIGEIQRDAKAAHMRLQAVKKLPPERRLEELREARLELIAAVSGIERLLSVVAAISRTVGVEL